MIFKKAPNVLSFTLEFKTECFQLNIISKNLMTEPPVEELEKSNSNFKSSNKKDQESFWSRKKDILADMVQLSIWLWLCTQKIYVLAD